MDLHRRAQRTKSLSIEPIDQHMVRFRASLDDHGESAEGTEVIHSLRLEGTISVPDLVIRSMVPTVLKQPYRECAASLEPLGRIVGMRIQSGFSMRVKELLGGTGGCSHFLALVLDVAASHTLTAYLRMRSLAKLDESDHENSPWTRAALAIEPRLENACIALASHQRPIRQAKSWRVTAAVAGASDRDTTETQNARGSEDAQLNSSRDDGGPHEG